MLLKSGRRESNKWTDRSQCEAGAKARPANSLAQRSDGVRDLAGSISLWTPTCEVADIVNKSFAFIGVTIPAMLCASQPHEDELQPSAVIVAVQRGASELGCPAAPRVTLTNAGCTKQRNDAYV